MVRRLRQSPLRRATSGWAAPGELWRQVSDPMRDNTPKKHGEGYKAQRSLPSFKIASGRVSDVCGVRAKCRCCGTGVSPSTKVTTKGLQRLAVGERFYSGQQGFLQLPLETATTDSAEGLRQWMHDAQVQTRVHSAERERCRTLAQS